MKTKEKLEQVLSMDFTKLVPSQFFKSELILLTNEEFEKLIKHLKISNYDVEQNNYDTIVITNLIFKKQ